MSSRLVKALRVLDLLQNRRAVSRDAIVRETGATERSVYRLIRLLSEADIPVIYDRERKGYKLRSQSVRVPLGFSLQEFTLVVFALDLLHELTGSEYRGELRDLRDRLVRCHPLDLDDLFSGHGLASRTCGLGHIETVLNSILISAAMEAGRGVEIDVNGADGTSRNVTVSVPSLVYKSPGWLIVDKGSHEKIAMNSVRVVRIKSRA